MGAIPYVKLEAALTLPKEQQPALSSGEKEAV